MLWFRQAKDVRKITGRVFVARGLSILIILVSILIAAAACSSTAPKSASRDSKPEAKPVKEQPKIEEEPAPSETPTDPKPEVKIVGSTFEPAELTVKAGATVVWTNADAVGHTIHDDNDAWKSEPLGQDGTFERKFDAPGTFTYHCHDHPAMRGTITVE